MTPDPTMNNVKMRETETLVSASGAGATAPANEEEFIPIQPPRRVPLARDEPATLAEIFTRAVIRHQKQDALN